MKEDQDSEWEVVDQIPGEQKRKRKPVRSKRPFYKSSLLWLGLGLGIFATFAFPPLAMLVRKLIGLWWLAIIVGLYYFYKRIALKKR